MEAPGDSKQKKKNRWKQCLRAFVGSVFCLVQAKCIIISPEGLVFPPKYKPERVIFGEGFYRSMDIQT